MATASCEGGGGGGGHTRTQSRVVDRFSNLPDELALYILSFLTIRDIINFGRVSKTCRQLHLSSPRLTFYGVSDKTISGCIELEQLHLLASMESALKLRCEKKIHHFHFRWRLCQSNNCFRSLEESVIGACINKLLRCKVEVLDINICDEWRETNVTFPFWFLNSGHLRSLSLSMWTVIKSPPCFRLSNLEYLNLAHVKIDEGFFKWISSSCKCIKELRLEHVSGSRNISIENSSLRSFSIVVDDGDRLSNLKISGEKLEDIHIQWWINSFVSQSLNIVAPNLKYLEWIGNSINHQLGKFSSLEKAEIDLVPNNDDGIGYDKVFEVLCSICSAKVLTLHESTIKALFKSGIQAPLDDVSSLRITIGSFMDYLVPAMASLFRGMPRLSTLYMKCDPPGENGLIEHCSGFNMEFWKLQNLAFISQLKEVTMELSDLSVESNAIEFSRFILEHARDLKKMVIVVHSPQLPQLSFEKLNDSKMTSNATVIFQEV